ncbi:PAS domain-containing protein [Alicycliphilus sp. T452]
MVQPVLSWQRGVTWRQTAEGVAVYGLALAAGQVIFLGWGGEWLRPLAHAYWQFLFVAWAGVRLGMAGTAGLLCLVTAQAGWGMLQGQGFFAQDLQATGGLGYGSYVLILSLVGTALASYLDVLRRQRADARIAAIAFECQEGLLITDARGVILRANRSFLAMSGYAAHEVLGRTPQFLGAAGCGRQGACCDAPPPWPAQQRRDWHRRKSGERYPVWFTCTPVADSGGRVTHHVLTLTDISNWRQQQAQRRQREQAHRAALVREVHHRIKNNLQGITGVLQTLGLSYPSLREPITEVTGQVQSIAVLHGLQGCSRVDQVRLCELVQEVAQGVGALWGVAIAVQLPAAAVAPGLPCCIQPGEAVPLALIVHELVLNAVKHGGRQHQDVRVALSTQEHRQEICLSISNPGRWPAGHSNAQVGLELVATLMPRSGATLAFEQIGGRAVARLCLRAPVLQHCMTETVPECHGRDC